MTSGRLRAGRSGARSVARAVRSAFARGGGASAALDVLRFLPLLAKYRGFTMASTRVFLLNLLVARRASRVPGCVVECGVWRGGMIAAIAEVLGPGRDYHLFDSFEGLPPAQPVDGAAALAWQARAGAHDNCRADAAFAERAMALSGARRVRLHPGWFDRTLPAFRPRSSIAFLRLDADWYASTRACLASLGPLVAASGVVVVDDYDAWEGCARAVDEYVSAHPQWRLRRAFGAVVVLSRRGGLTDG